MAKAVAAKLGTTLREGVLAYYPNTPYEAAAEVRAIRTLGGDATGSSLINEAIAVVHMGVPVLAISSIVNFAEGVSPTPLSHDEVIGKGEEMLEPFSELMDEIIRQILLPLTR